MTLNRRTIELSTLALSVAMFAGCSSAPPKQDEPAVTVAKVEKPQPKKAQAYVVYKEDTQYQNTAPATVNTQAQRQQQELEAKRAAYHQRYQQEQARKQEEARRQAQARQAQARQQAMQRQQQYQQQQQQRKMVQQRPVPRAVAHAPRSQGYGGQGVGNYYATQLTGNFATPEIRRVIDRLVRVHGFNRQYLYGVFSQARYSNSVANTWAKYYSRPKKQKKPSEPGRSSGAWSRYRGKFLVPSNIAKGKQFYNQYRSHLLRAERQYGVPASYIVGIIGVETRWGRIFGKNKIIEALATSALAVKHRQKFFLSELENFMLMTKTERMDPLKPKGSYAGAMGYGQFMPSSFRSYAVDFNGDGIRDLWNPVDAIGSVANYFKRHGWRTGESVVVPAKAVGTKYTIMKDGYKKKYTMGQLAASGIKPAARYNASPSNVHLLALSAIGRKEAWIGFKNFYVITRYNHSTYYAMTVHQLGQAVIGNTAAANYYARR